MTIAITKEIELDAGHRVPNHVSKCRNPHGHRYRFRVMCVGQIVDDPTHPDFGMLTDFANLKTLMTTRIHDVLDHAMIVHQDDTDLLDAMDGRGWKVIVFPTVPTAENLAVWAWDQLEQAIHDEFDDLLELAEIAVWETPTSVAYYRGAA